MAKGSKQRRRTKSNTPDDPQPRAFVPRPCTACLHLRPPQTNYSRVYAVRGKTRYIKCHFCRETWTQVISADQLAMPAVLDRQQKIDAAADSGHSNGHGNITERNRHNPAISD